MKFLSLTILTLALLLAESNLVYSHLFNKCDSSHGEFISVSVTNCKDSDPYCILKKNQNMKLTMDFVPNVNAQKADVRLYGKLAGVKIPFQFSPSDACGNYGLTCPLQSGKPAQITIEVPIQPVFPNIQVIVILELVDETSNNLACVSFKGKITP